MKKILALDVSTSKIGISLVNASDNSIILAEVFKMKPSLSMLAKARLVDEHLRAIKKEHALNKENLSIFIEAPLVLFSSGKKAAYVISILQRFNGMVSYITYDVFDLEPTLLNVNSVRAKLGIKRVKGRKLKTRDKKQPTIDHIVKIYEGTETPWTYELTRFGNPAVGTDDIADALALALAGPKLIK